MTNNSLFFGTDTRAINYANSGSKALAMADPNNTLTLQKTDLSAFNLISIEFLPLGLGPGATVTFTKFLFGGGTVTSSSAAVVPTENITHIFDKSFTNLASVQWRKSSPFHSFDNITNAITLPAALTMLLIGLGVFGLLGRIRKS